MQVVLLCNGFNYIHIVSAGYAISIKKSIRLVVEVATHNNLSIFPLKGIRRLCLNLEYHPRQKKANYQKEISANHCLLHPTSILAFLETYPILKEQQEEKNLYRF
jgi:hypothetical protein